jgi:enamidase
LIRELIKRRVALTSTLTVFETLAPGRPLPPGLDVLVPELRDQFMQRFDAAQRNATSSYSLLLPKARQLEVDYFRAGGLLLAGTDPTGGGGVIPGYSNQREVELLVESGLTQLEAIKVATLNGAIYLGRADRVGSIAPGKQADLVVIGGDPSAKIEDIRKVELVFKDGVAYDPAKLIASVRGKVGLF